jgi:hypothetical protein
MFASNHILMLARNNKPLLKDFQKQLEPLNVINAHLKMMQSKSSSLTLFNPHSPQSSVTSQLASVTDKITILNMIQMTENFAGKFLSRQQYQLAKATYFNHTDEQLPTQTEVMQQLSLNHPKRAMKLLRTIELLSLLNTGFETGKTKILTEHLENQIHHETSALNLFQSKQFLLLVKQLKHMSNTTLRPVNDSHHVEPQVSNTRKTAAQSHRLSG